MPLDHTARDVFPIAPTPSHEDGSLDLESVDRMTDCHATAGAIGLTVLGVMGEAPKLDGAEALDLAVRFNRLAGHAGRRGADGDRRGGGRIPARPPRAPRPPRRRADRLRARAP